MNSIQRAYGSYDKTNRLIKLTNSYYHNKNLDLIKHRKNQYNNYNVPTTVRRKKKSEPYKDFFVIRENKIFSNKLNDIKWQPVKPKINTVFYKNESNFMKCKERYKYLHDTHQSEENERYKRRLHQQKAFLSTQEMDNKFNDEHMKTVQKLRRVPDDKNIVLPRIKIRNESNVEDEENEGNEENKKNEGSSSDSDSRIGKDEAKGIKETYLAPFLEKQLNKKKSNK